MINHGYRHTLKKITKRKKYYHRAKLTQNPFHWHKFKTLRNEVVSLIRTAKQNYFQKLAISLKSETLTSKDWWKLLKNFISPADKQTIPPLFNPVTYKVVFDSFSKAKILNEFFSAQASIINQNTEFPRNLCQSPRNKLEICCISPQDVEDALRSLKTNKASGPDGINNRILRETASVLKHPLCSLFNQSLQCSTAPLMWKDANVCAVFKKGDPSLPNEQLPTNIFTLLYRKGT
jgi:hypothetical protein